MQHYLPDLTVEEVELFKNFLSAHTAPLGTILVELGDDDRDLYFIESGLGEIYQKFTLGENLFALQVGTLKPPAMLGEANLLLGTRRNATIIVSKEIVYFRLSYEDFCAIKTEHPALAIKLLERVGQLATTRFLDMQKSLVDRFLAEIPAPRQGIKYLERFMGSVRPCSPELARKIFNMDQPAITE
jgi:CRP-like cAMP-binding protein